MLLIHPAPMPVPFERTDYQVLCTTFGAWHPISNEFWWTAWRWLFL